MICARGIRGASDGPVWAARQVAGGEGPLVTTLEAWLVTVRLRPRRRTATRKVDKLKSRAETRLCVVYDVCWNSYSEIFSLRVVVLAAVYVE